MKKITPHMTIGEILKLKPEALSVLESHGLTCAHCGLNSMETLAEGAHAHGLSKKEAREILDKLN